VGVSRGGAHPPKSNEESFLISREPQTRDKIGAFAGVSGRTVEQIAAVVTAAEREPDRFGPSAVLRHVKVDARVTVDVATPPKGAGWARGFCERYALPAIDNGEPGEAFRTLESLVRQTLLSADEEAKIGALVRQFAEATR
jgi:hypothetical protein